MYTKLSGGIAARTRGVFYRFLGDACMTGRGFRGESCSRGLSTQSQWGGERLLLRRHLKNAPAACIFTRPHSTTNLATVV